jgi:hypothetical protein
LSSLSVSGNANIGNIGTTLITATGNVTGANLVTGGVLSVTGNANIGNIGANNAIFTLVTGTVTTNAQPNITSTGTLSSLSVSGNANIGNIGTAIITATGNVTGANLVTGGVLSVTGNANIGNIGANNAIFTLVTGTVTTAAQPNITSTGTLSSLSVSGNANIGNIGTTLITATGNITGANLVTGGVLSVTGNANIGNIGTTLITATGNITGANLVTGGVLSVTGNANIGNIGTAIVTATGNITGANLVTGGVLSVTGNANIGNIGTTLITATGNITGANLITGGVLSVTGNANIGNLSVSGTIAGNGNPLTALNASNISTGTVGTARLGSNTANAQTWLRGDSSWANIQTGILINDDAVSNSSFNVLLSNTANANYTTTVTISSAALYFNPATGVLSATNFNSLSDQNFKTNVIRLSNASTMLNELNGYSFDWKDSVSGSSYGVIAQEVEKVLPNAVTEQNGRKSVNYNAVTALLIETVKDLNQQVKDLRTEIDKLK